jgi:hypothetical protein
VTTEKIQAVAHRMVDAFPDPLEVDAIVDEDRVVFICTAHTVEGPYPVAGHLSLDELIELDERQAAALVLMRSLLDDGS